MAVSESRFVACLRSAEGGADENHDRFFTLLYAELRQMAQHALKGHAVTLSPTSLLHEAFLNISQRDSLNLINRGQFMTYAGRAMRGLIIDHLRNRRAQKRGGRLEITSLSIKSPEQAPEDVDSPRLERLSEAIEALAKIDVRLAECVDLKFFCGYSYQEIAQFRNVNERTVRRDWDKARILLDCILKHASDK